MLQEKAEEGGALKQASEDLQKILMELGLEMHKAGHDPHAADAEKVADESGEPEIKNADEAEVIDADFEEKKDK